MLKRLLFGLFVSLLLVGCSAKSVQTVEEEKPPVIENNAYYLVSFGKTRMAVPKKAKILLREGQYAGNAGCNGLSGKYDLDGDKIKFHSGISTMMACEDMSGETRFRKLLDTVDNWSVHDDTMILKDGDKEILIFQKR